MKPKDEKIAKLNSKLRFDHPSLPTWPPAKSWNYRLDDAIPSDQIRLPWANPPEYLDRKTLRGVAQIPFYYDVCLGNNICDPLKVHEYFVKRRVFAATHDLPADNEGQKAAYKTACKVLEEHFDIPRNTLKQRRTTKRKATRLPLTCETPKWMARWVSPEPELVSDHSD